MYFHFVAWSCWWWWIDLKNIHKFHDLKIYTCLYMNSLIWKYIQDYTGFSGFEQANKALSNNKLALGPGLSQHVWHQVMLHYITLLVMLVRIAATCDQVTVRMSSSSGFTHQLPRNQGQSVATSLPNVMG